MRSRVNVCLWTFIFVPQVNWLRRGEQPFEMFVVTLDACPHGQTNFVHPNGQTSLSLDNPANVLKWSVRGSQTTSLFEPHRDPLGPVMIYPLALSQRIQYLSGEAVKGIQCPHERRNDEICYAVSANVQYRFINSQHQHHWHHVTAKSQLQP